MDRNPCLIVTPSPFSAVRVPPSFHRLPALAYKSSDCLFQYETEVFLAFGFSDPSAGPSRVCPYSEDFSESVLFCAYYSGGETFLVKGGECVGMLPMDR